MTTLRKIVAGAAVAAGLAAATTAVFADPPGGFGRGYGPGMMGGGYGPGMMYQGGGYGPGMMGGGPRGGYGPGAGAGCVGGGQGAAAGAPCAGVGPGAAAGAPCAGFGPGAGAAVAPTERVEQRLAFLKNELKITSEQEAAWNAYAEQAKAQAATMQAFRAQAPAAAQSPAERFEQRAERMNLRAKQMTAMSAAVKDLYAALTPEQKATADLHFGGGRRLSQGPRGYGWQR